MKEPIRIMFLSNHPGFVTGYAKVIRELCNRIAANADFKVFVIGEQAVGMPIQYGPFTLLSRRDGGTDLVNHYLEQIKPHFFIWLEDTFTMASQGATGFKFPPITKFIPYIPQDGDFIPTTGHSVLNRADLIVPMAKWSKEVTEKEGYKCEAPSYHGVNYKLFKPAVDPKERNEIRKMYGLGEDDFVVLYVGRNSARKLNQAWLDIVGDFASKYDNVKIFGHIPHVQVHHNDLIDYTVRCLPMKFGKRCKDMLNNKIIFSKRAQSLTMGINENDIANLYKMADVYFSAASGEGFGMPLAEAMSCEVPVVAVDYTTTKELLIDEVKDSKDEKIGLRGIGVEPATTWVGSFNVEHAIIDHDRGVEALEKLYNDSELRREMGENGRRFVREYCDWDKIADEWKTLFKNNVNKIHKETKSKR